MNRLAAQVQVQQILGFRGDLVQQIITAMQNAQTEFENEPDLPWFLRKTYLNTFATVANSQTLTLPTDFIRENEEDQLNITLLPSGSTYSSSKPLPKEDLGYLRTRFGGRIGLPEYYARIDASTLYLFPTLIKPILLLARISQHDTALTMDSTENKWLKYIPELFITEAALVIATGTRDQMLSS